MSYRINFVDGSSEELVFSEKTVIGVYNPTPNNIKNAIIVEMTYVENNAFIYTQKIVEFAKDVESVTKTVLFF